MSSLQLKKCVLIFLLSTLYSLLSTVCFAQEEVKPVVVKGDRVEYLAEQKKVEASGNVVITYQDMKLTCDYASVNMHTKEARAKGNVVLYQNENLLKGEEATYNFETKKGDFLKGAIQASPWYGRGEEGQKVAENEFHLMRGYITTCDLEKPHYRIQSRQVKIFLDDRVVAKNILFFVGNVPILYLPSYVHKIEGRPRVTLIPGKKKPWGSYLLTAWRYYFNEAIKGRIRVDWRENWGVAEGIDLNYSTPGFGEGKLRLYYTQQRDRNIPEGFQAERERFRIQSRHKWQVDPQTDAIFEYHRQSDSELIKDYYEIEEHEKDPNPESYLMVTRNMPYYTLSLLTRKRVNRFDSVTELLPELKLDVRNTRIGDTRLYYEGQSSFANLTNKTANSHLDDDAVRLDTYNKLSYLTKLGFISASPYVGLRQTYFSKDTFGDENKLRTAFYSGVDFSTKFYRIFDIKSDLLGLDIHRLRHIITPSAQYSYIHEPTIPSSKLMSFDSIDSISRQSRVNLSLENKLQTKRKGETVDLARLILSTDYNFKQEEGSRFSDVTADLELTPYDWLRIESDTAYDTQAYHFKNVNLDIVAEKKDKWFFGLGHRYQRKGSKQMTTEASLQLNPKWKLRAYQRYEFTTDDLEEQEYTISRDLHCWIMEVTYNVRREVGETLWVVFRLKAFPEVEFEFNRSYHQPKIGSQTP